MTQCLTEISQNCIHFISNFLIHSALSVRSNFERYFVLTFKNMKRITHVNADFVFKKETLKMKWLMLLLCFWHISCHPHTHFFTEYPPPHRIYEGNLIKKENVSCNWSEMFKISLILLWVVFAPSNMKFNYRAWYFVLVEF